MYFSPLDHQKATTPMPQIWKDLGFTLQSDGEVTNLVAYHQFAEPGIISYVETIPNISSLLQVNFTLVGPNLPFRYFSTKMNFLPILRELIKKESAISSPGDDQARKDLIKSDNWTEKDLKGMYSTAYSAPFLKVKVLREFITDSALKINQINLHSMDPIWVEATDQVAGVDPFALNLEMIDALYSNELTKALDEVLSILQTTNFNPKSRKLIDPKLAELEGLRSEIPGVFLELASAETTLVLHGDEVDSTNMENTDTFEIEPGSDELVHDDDIVYSRDSSEISYFKMQDLPRILNEGSPLANLFVSGLKQLKVYAKSRLGLGVMLFFAAQDTHFTKSNSSPMYEMHYQTLYTQIIQFQATPMTKQIFSEYISLQNKGLLLDIFLNQKNAWKKALYGEQFLFKVYQELLTKIIQILDEIESFDTDDEFEVTELTTILFEVFKSGPFLTALKGKIGDISETFAGKYFDAKTNDESDSFDESIAALMNRPTMSFLVDYFYIPNVLSGQMVTFNQNCKIRDFFEQTTIDESMFLI